MPRLPEQGMLAAFRQVIDETYRYHQWWGRSRGDDSNRLLRLASEKL